MNNYTYTKQKIKKKHRCKKSTKPSHMASYSFQVTNLMPEMLVVPDLEAEQHLVVKEG